MNIRNMLGWIIRNYPILILVALFLFRFEISPGISNAYPIGSDAPHSIHNAQLFYEHGFQFWDISQGNGTPARRFYPPLATFIVALLANILPFLVAYNLVFALSFALVPIFYYLWLRDLRFNRLIATLATLLFSLASVHFASGLFTGALTRIFSYNLLFLFLIFMQRAIRKESNIIYPLLFFCLIALAYYPSAYIGAAISSIYFLVYWYDNRKEGFKFINIKKLFFVFLLSILLLSFWFLPIIREIEFLEHSPKEVGQDNILVNFLKTVINTSGTHFFSGYYNTYYFSPLGILILNFFKFIYSIFLVFFLIYSFKDLKFASISLLFIFNLYNLRSILPFYLFEEGHMIFYGIIFTSYVVVFGIHEFYSLRYNILKKFLMVLLIIFIIISIFGFYKYRVDIFVKDPIFTTNDIVGFDDYINYMKNHSIEKVHVCGGFGSTQPYITGPLYAYTPQLLNDYGIRTLNAYLFKAYPGAPLLHYSIPDFSKINTSEELYNTLALRDVDAVILGIFDPKLSPECSPLIEERLYDRRYFEEFEITSLIEDSPRETWLLTLKGDIHFINCDEKVKVNYYRNRSTEFRLNFLDNARALSCILAETYYPRWKAYKDDEEIKLGSYEGLMVFSLNEIKKDDYITFRYEKLWYHKLALGISILTLGVLIVLYLWKRDFFRD